MKRYSFSWNEKATKDIYDESYWVESWYTDFTFRLFKRSEWRFCIAKYDGVPYFLIIFWRFMFRLGKRGHWD
jgi:hypothetical protein